MNRKVVVFIGLLGVLIGLASMGWMWQRNRSKSQSSFPTEQVEAPTSRGSTRSLPNKESTSMSARKENTSTDQSNDEFTRQRRQMVRRQLASRDIIQPDVLDAFQKVQRHQFVPENLKQMAYSDGPLPIGYDQTISQPYIVALMTQLAAPSSRAKALDIGTGSGYQAAILAELVDQVFTIEIVEPLAEAAKHRLETLGYQNVFFRTGDGFGGWPEEAPFDLIIVAAAPEEVPPALMEQLAIGGKLVIPVGSDRQSLMLIEKHGDGTFDRRQVTPVRFVPMTGKALGDR